MMKEKNFLSLLSVIRCRSPLLESLSITFYCLKTMLEPSPTEPNPKKRRIEPPEFSDIGRLHSLKRLTMSHKDAQRDSPNLESIPVPLFHDDDGPETTILGAVQKFFPALEELSLFGFCIRKKDIIDLVVDGDFKEIVSTLESKVDAWSNERNLTRLHVPSVFTSSICSSLKKFCCGPKIQCGNPKCGCYVHRSVLKYADHKFVFFLRHFGKLEFMNSSVPTANLVNCLLKSEELVSNPEQVEVETVCRLIFAARFGYNQPFISPFSGNILLFLHWPIIPL